MKAISLLFLCLCCTSATAQVNAAFIKHLDSNNLAREHRAYLNSLPQQNDSTAYFETKFNLKYFNDSLFLNYYSKGNVLCSADTLLSAKAGKLFLTGSTKKFRDQWFTSVHVIENNSTDLYFRKLYNASVNPNTYTKNDFAPELQRSFLSYKKIYNKKPLLGAALSTAVPGLGKLYAGKPGSSLLTFLLNAGYAAQTIESGKKLGIKHPFTIVNAAAFAVFYFSNIYGSYKAIVDLKKERKKQLLIDATNFYN